MRQFISFFWVVVFTELWDPTGLFLAAKARAAMTHEEYLHALKIADEAVRRTQTQPSLAHSLVGTPLRSLVGRYYEVGDTWDVAALNINRNMMRKTSDPAFLKEEKGVLGVFRYRVTKVGSGPEPEVLIEVAQADAYGQRPVDARIERLSLVVNDQLRQRDKAYRFRDSESAVRVSSGGLRTRVTPLELFPLDVPRIEFARETEAPPLSEGSQLLPPALREVARQAGRNPDLSQGTWFEQDDFFGRPIQFLWKQGDPWPAYVKTPNGIAILLGRGTQ